MTYAEKLRDPRWQRRKSEVQRKADFTCEDCGSKTATLEVHHCLYIIGREPWEYDDDLLMLVCRECHPRRQELEDQARYAIALTMRRMSIYDLERFVLDPIAMKIKRDHVADSGELNP